MAESEWTNLTGTALGSGDVVRGVSAAFIKATGAGTYVYGFRSVTSSIGFAGKYCNLANFGPIPANKGASLRFLIKRYASGVNYAPFIGLYVGVDPATATGYRLGLSGASAYQIVLSKGAMATNLLASGTDVLRASTETFTGVGDAAAYWFHLRLDVLVNPHGDVSLLATRNTAALATPSWAYIPGIGPYIDDSIGALSGSSPSMGPFYVVYGMYTQGSGSIALFDHIEVWRQTSP